MTETENKVLEVLKKLYLAECDLNQAFMRITELYERKMGVNCDNCEKK